MDIKHIFYIKVHNVVCSSVEKSSFYKFKSRNKFSILITHMYYMYRPIEIFTSKQSIVHLHIH